MHPEVTLLLFVSICASHVIPSSLNRRSLTLGNVTTGTNNITATKIIDQRSPHVALRNGTTGTLPDRRDLVVHDGLAAAPTLTHRAPISLTGTVRWKPLGCYTDMDGNRTLRYPIIDIIRITNKLPMTIKRCQDGCYKKGYRFAGLEFGYQCFCDYEAPSRRKREGKPNGQSGCELPFAKSCEGDPLKACGGGNRIDIYKYDGDIPNEITASNSLETPSTPDTASMPGIPGTGDTPSTQNTQSTLDTPSEPDTPSSPETPGIPGMPDTASKPDTPSSPETPGVPGTPGTLDTTSKPKPAGTSSSTDIPSKPDTASMADSPTTPSRPDTPGTAGMGTTSSTGSTPDNGTAPGRANSSRSLPIPASLPASGAGVPNLTGAQGTPKAPIDPSSSTGLAGAGKTGSETGGEDTKSSSSSPLSSLLAVLGLIGELPVVGSAAELLGTGLGGLGSLGALAGVPLKL